MTHGGAGAWSPGRWLSGGLDRSTLMVAGVATLGLIMAALDTTIVNVALDTLSRELHSPLSTNSVGIDRLPAVAGSRDPPLRLAYRTVRLKAHMDRLDRIVRARLRTVRVGDLGR